MPLIPFGPYLPDVSDYEASSERDAQNVVPRGDGFGPFPSLTALSSSLGAQCRGAFVGSRSDGSVLIFAGTATDLYVMNNTTFGWTKVSLSGGYPALSAGDQWQFVQFDSFVIAVQANAPPQYYDMSASSAFANLGGSPPQARYVAVVGRFVMLSGLLSNPNRIQWSGLDDPTSAQAWTPGVNSADYQDLPDGGFVRGVAGSDQGGIILQDTAIRLMTYVAGSPIIFQIERISQDKGLYGPYSLVRAGPTIFFFTPQGFYRVDPGLFPTPIGRERIDRTFFADLDTSNLQLFLGVADPRNSRILWAYKSVNGTSNQFDKMLCYDWVLDKFTSLQISGEYLLQVAQPGVTLEALDALAPGATAVVGTANNGAGLIRIQVASTAALAGRTLLSISGVVGTTEANGNWFFTIVDGTHIDLIGSMFVHAYVSGGLVGGSLDAMTQSLDNFSTAVTPELAAFDTSHNLNFFRGPALQATLETAEQGTDGRRLRIRGFRPITDAGTVYGSASSRENQQQAPTAGTESLINPVTGRCDMLVNTRYSRYKTRIPAGTAWTFIAGVEPDVAASGTR